MTRPLAALLFAALLCGATLQAVALDDAFHISGTVVNANDGSPIGRCQVMIDPGPAERRRQSLIKTVVTSSDGRFQFNNIPEGKYSLVARHNGYRTQPLNEHEGFTTAVVVGPDKDSQNIIFRLQPSSSISGRIEDEFGDAVAEGQVSLFRRAALFGKTLVYPRGRVNIHDGGYHFHNLPPGEYFVVALAKPWYAQYQQFPAFQPDGTIVPPQRDPEEADLDLTFPITYYSGALDGNSATPITLRPGERATADMRLIAQPGFHLTITLPEGDSPKPIARNIQATVFGVAMNLDPMTRNVSGGRVADISGVPAGNYRVRERVVSSDSVSAESRREVSVSSSGEVEYKNAIEGTPVTGKIELDGVAGPVKETTIQLDKYESGEVVQAHSRPNGDLAPFQLFPGRYQYSMSSNQGVIKSFKATGAKVIGRTIEVGTEPVSITVTVANVAVEIEGTVRSKDGKPVSGAMVVIIPEDPEHNENIFRRDQSDSDGTFTLKVVMPGRYVLVALQDGWDLEWSKIDAMRRFLPQGVPVEIRPSQDATLDVIAQSAK